VAGEVVPALVDLLRRHQAQDAQDARLGALLRRRREDLSYEEKLDRYAAIADERFETARFEEFCANAPGHLDEVAWTSSSPRPEAKDAVRQKVAALFPAHEVERFTELFWQRIQGWRAAGAWPTR
jgi:hypothetical protein